MAWDLNGSDQYARFTMSAALKAATGGPFTFGAIVNLDATTDGALVHFLDGTSGRHFLEIFGTYNWGTAAAAKSGPSGVTGAWYNVILTKATGTVTPEYTVTPLATGIPVSGTCTGGNLANGAAPGASGQIQIGRFATSASEYVDGKVAGLWGHASYMDQAAREALTTWSGIVTAASVSGLGWAVHLDTLSTITDATGQGGDETGRFGTTPFTLVSDPANFFGSGATATPATVQGVGTLPTATKSAGSTVTAVAVAGVGSFPAATKSAGSTVTAVAVAGVGAVPAATPAAGSTVTAVAVAGVGTLPASTPAAGSTVAAVAVAAVGALPAPATSTGTTVTATAVTGAGTVPEPTLSTGVTVAATVVTGVGALPAPAVSAGGSATAAPDAVSGTGTLPAPAVATGATASPATTVGVGAVPAPTVTISVTISATAVLGVGTVPAPVVDTTGGATVTPAAVVGVGVVPAPVVSAGGAAPPPVIEHVSGGRLIYVIPAPIAHVATSRLVHVSA